MHQRTRSCMAVHLWHRCHPDGVKFEYLVAIFPTLVIQGWVSKTHRLFSHQNAAPFLYLSTDFTYSNLLEPENYDFHIEPWWKRQTPQT